MEHSEPLQKLATDGIGQKLTKALISLLLVRFEMPPLIISLITIQCESTSSLDDLISGIDMNIDAVDLKLSGIDFWNRFEVIKINYWN
ncbi:hypothetical protein L1887_14853 [Cichorium endivia]|nr:hypothetical protein L1887_14853 [Cichorium endivia]